MSFDKNYYSANEQDRDRPALKMYERIWRKYLGRGPTLEFGCGVGFFAMRLSRHTKVFGLETNPHAIKMLRDRNVCEDVFSDCSQVPSNAMGSITALHVLEHIQDSDLVTLGQEFSRILMPQGRLLFVMPDLTGRAHLLKDSHWKAFEDPTHINLKGAYDWRRLLEDQWGFNVVEAFADGYYDFPYGKLSAIQMLGDAWRGFITLSQFLLAKPIISVGNGENVVFILEKKT